MRPSVFVYGDSILFITKYVYVLISLRAESALLKWKTPKMPNTVKYILERNHCDFQYYQWVGRGCMVYDSTIMIVEVGRWKYEWNKSSNSMAARYESDPAKIFGLCWSKVSSDEFAELCRDLFFYHVALI